MKRTFYLLIVLWLLAGGICGVRYRIANRNADERITREEAESMVREAREETRIAVLKEVDEKQAKETAEAVEAAGEKWVTQEETGEDAKGIPGASGDAEGASGEIPGKTGDAEGTATGIPGTSVDAEGTVTGLPDSSGDAEGTEDAKEGIRDTDNEAKGSGEGLSDSENARSVGEKTKYYKATVNGASNLRIRDGASNLSGELGTIREGTSGYVIKKGDAWTLLAINGQVGYMSTRYLVIEEIDPEDYPEELLSLSEVNAGDEISFE